MPDYRASWYSQLPAFGWFDSEDKPGSNALGVPDWKQGIALPSRRTLGQWFNVTAPGGQSYRLQQTDVGPASWTGRGVDISAAAANAMGYTPKTFPTDASFSVEPAEGGSMPDMPSAQGRRNMPNPTLMDMLQPQEQSFGDRLGGMSNSLIGLGMGLLQPYNPWRGTNAWTNALEGLQTGSALDQRAAAQRQQLATQAYDRQFREREAQRQANQWQQEFGLKRQQFERGLEGDWSIVDAGNDLFPQKMLFNKRTMELRPLPGTTTAGGTAGPSPFESGDAIPYVGAGPFRTGAQAPTAPATPAASTAQPPEGYRNENYLRGLGPNSATLVKGVANYEIDPSTLDAKVRAQIITAAKNYRPDYSTAEYQKRASPPPAEVQARIGLGKEFLDRLGDVNDQTGNSIAGLKTRVARGELNDLPNRALAVAGQGGPGEIRRAIDSGADALMRGLTGAGMSIPEAQNYARRYQFSPLDTRATSVQKLNELESALRHVMTKQGEGRGGEDFLKGFRSTYGQPTTEAPSAGAATRTGGAAVAQPVRVNSPAEARQLPKGTPIILPDGRTGTVP